MDSKAFELLLNDLYDIYNPSKKRDIDSLVKNYNGREFDAIKTIIIRYNFKGHPGYDENANRDEYINFLISKYSEGQRPISKENRLKQSEFEEAKKQQELQLEEERKRKELEEEKEVILNVGNEVKQAIKNEVDKLKENIENQLNKKMSDMDSYFKKKKEEFEKREKLIREVEKNVINFSGQTLLTSTEEKEEDFNHTRINIDNLNFTDSDIKLPGEDVLGNLAKGTKLILFNSEGRVCGIEVKDITYDLVSYEGEIVKEIILEQI
jgi:hypothetical protein